MPDEKANSGIVSIDSLPKDLETVDRPPLASGAPSVPHVEDSYQGGILSAGIGLQTDTAATQLPGTIPVFRLQTVPPSGQPTVGAAVQSGVAIGSSKSSSGGGGTIGLNIPSIFTPTSQAVTLPGPLSFSLADEPANTVFAGPASSSGPGGGYVDQTSTNEDISGVVSLSITPVNVPTTAFFAATALAPFAGPATTPIGYTGLEVDTNDFIFWKQLSGTGTESPSSSWSLSSACASALFNVNGSLTLVMNGITPQIASLSGGISGPPPRTMPFPATCVAGNAILVFAFIPAGYYHGTGITGFSVSDNQGNTYYPIASLTDVAESPTCMYVLIAPNIVAGTNAIIFTAFNPPSGTGGQVYAFEFSGAGHISAASPPTFRALVDADLPVVDAPHGGTGLATLPAYNVLLGEGTSAVGAAAPGTAGQVLTSNGVAADPTFQAPPTIYYQTVQQAGTSKPQESKLNFTAPITATDNPGNTSTDIAVPVFVGSGASHATGLVPDPGASAGTTKYLREDATWDVPSGGGGGGTAVEINGVGVSSDKQFYFNGVADVVSVWGVQINGAAG